MNGYNFEQMLHMSNEELEAEQEESQVNSIAYVPIVKSLSAEHAQYRWSSDDHEALILAPETLKRLEDAVSNLLGWTMREKAAEAILSARAFVLEHSPQAEVIVD